jgi:hypothetical protein
VETFRQGSGLLGGPAPFFVWIGGDVLARDYFEQARACQRTIARRLAVLESMTQREAVRAQRYDVIGHGSCADAMAVTDARLDAEASLVNELRDYRAELAGAREVCRGVRLANPTQRWGDALELRYIEDMPWRLVSQSLGVSERQAQCDVSCALDWVDMVGISRARTGAGTAASD